MQEFNDIKNLWKQTENPEISAPKIDFGRIRSNKQNLKNKQVFVGVTLVITGIFIFTLMIWLDEKLKTDAVKISMIVISVLCLLQAILHFFNAQKLSKIDETQTPEIHLKQWQDYQIFQKKQRHWNLPIYYLILGTAISVYLYEILKITDTWKMIVAYTMTYGWFIISYFWLGKKQIKKQDAKIDGIIAELKNLENQFL